MEMKRRDFMRLALIGAAGAAMAIPTLADLHRPVKIEKIDLYPVLYPTVMRFKFFEGPTIKGKRPAVIVKITADDGTVGWGESVPSQRWSYETFESVETTLRHYLAPALIGMNPFDLHTVHRVMNTEIADGYSTGAPIAKAGIDLALHDLMGKVAGCNIAELWGRSLPDDLLLSWTLNPVTLDDVEPLIQKGRDAGYENFNVKVGPDLEFDIEMVRMLKRLVPDGFLWGDANGGYDLVTALAAAPKLAEAGMAVFEQPVKANRLSGFQQLKHQGALPIIMDEGVISPTDLIEFMKLGCLDGVAMKPARCGGLVSASQQIKIAQDSGLMVLGSGLTDPDISLAGSLILYGAFGISYPAALNGPQFLGESVIAEPFKPQGGRVRIPKGPGLGIEVDEEKVLRMVEETRAA